MPVRPATARDVAEVDVLVLGGGVAGLSAAVHAARLGYAVSVVTKAELGASATQYAQGGVAAVLGSPIESPLEPGDSPPDEPVDSPELHLSDTVSAGAGLCDLDAVRVLVTEGPRRVRELMGLGAEFDRGVGDVLALAREGGHTVARIVHAGGDATGAEVERALVAALLAVGATVHERWLARDLLVEDGRGVGVQARDPGGVERELRARHVVLATGGAGQCFAVTTNPTLSTGDGIAMALRAGVAVADLEFMQFHPTALHHPSMPRPLLSEALRGEGAVLRDDRGRSLMADEHPLGDLAPRDVVARAITRYCNEHSLDHVWLDATAIEDFAHRFPTVRRACVLAGLEPEQDWLPVAPAAHYLSGGVCADLDGATTLPGLWACGEVACSGVHGANRLASNSLLDGLVFGARTIEAIARGKDGPEETGVLRGILGRARARFDRDGFEGGQGTAGGGAPGLPEREVRDVLQHTMTRNAGVLRDAESLAEAAEVLDGLAAGDPGRRDPEVDNLVTVSQGLVAAAIAREESRGTHTRLDYPESRGDLLGRFVLEALPAAPVFVELPERAAAR